MRMMFSFLAWPALAVAQQPDTTRPPVTLPPVVTTATSPERMDFEEAPNVGRLTMRASLLTSAPRFFGEADVLRAVRTLPGVNARNDYSVGMNVRGGEADQNLVLLDGHPIYNPFHMGGIFGTFVEPMVGDVEFLTGGFPARYGGRLSSVLDVKSKVEPRAGMHGSANVSMIATTLSLGTATQGGRNTWNVAARRTYADKVIDMFYDQGVPYHFRDAQVHTTHVLPAGWQLATTWYDNLDELTQPADVDDLLHLAWGNRLLGVNASRRWDDQPRLWGLRLGDSARIEQRFSRSRFDMDMNLVNGALTLGNVVNDRRAAGALTTYTERHTRTFGYEIGRQDYDFSANYPLYLYPADTIANRNTSYGVYVDDQWRAGIRWIVHSGLRLDAVSPLPGVLVQPRLAVKYFVTPDIAVTGAYGEYAQWAHSLAREDVPVRALDFWAGSDSRAPVSRARHFVLGVERWLPNDRALRVEAFLKLYPRLVEQNPNSDPTVPGDEFLRLRGYSYGADLMLRQFDAGPVSGWLSYSFAFSRRVDHTGRAFFPGQDRRHELNLVASRKGGRFTQAARFNIATGTPYTIITGEYGAIGYDPVRHTLGGSSSSIGFPRFLTAGRNTGRLPFASRLDLSATRNGNGDVRISPFISIMNVYNARNPFAYAYDYGKSPPTRVGLPQLPVFPTVGVSVVW